MMSLEDISNIALLVLIVIGGGITTLGVLLLYVMAMFFANERE
jgi:hypothetical protein